MSSKSPDHSSEMSISPSSTKIARLSEDTDSDDAAQARTGRWKSISTTIKSKATEMFHSLQSMLLLDNPVCERHGTTCSSSTHKGKRVGLCDSTHSFAQIIFEKQEGQDTTWSSENVCKKCGSDAKRSGHHQGRAVAGVLPARQSPFLNSKDDLVAIFARHNHTDGF